jgi:SAM-dependent methyltransferase
MLAGFSSLQNLESRLVRAGMSGRRPMWMMEVAPTASASPAVELLLKRVLIDADVCRWPFECELARWPLPDDSIPAILLRHVWQPEIEVDLLSEAARVLRPGGLLVSVSANPWHRRAWRELGRKAFHLPSWPQFQWMHSRHSLALSVSANEQVRGLVPGLAPVLVLVSHKPAEPARIEPVRFGRPEFAAGSAVPTQCRAA